ncbi:MAG: ParB/RepB/Spo0J family partition protein [Gluconacetobacter diazotrophicus]|nr:ParB/RepB/Spo0J family partition protein [Gluconacetobacter diazotrophicus]
MSRKDISPPRLGRGLAALLGERGPSEDGLRTLPVDTLEPGPFQPRQLIEPEPLQELADSIRARGLLQPILARPHPGRPGRYQIIAGERRWRAAAMAGLPEIPVHLRTLADPEAMAASLVENLQRRDLNAIEEAEGLRRLSTEFRMTQEQLAGAVGKSRSHVANILRLLLLPDAVRRDVSAGALSAGHARALLSHPDPTAAARDVIARGLSVRDTEALVQDAVRAREAVDAPQPDAEPDAEPARSPRNAELVSLERDLRSSLGLRVDLRFNGRGGRLSIHYGSLEQLDGLIRLLRP